MADQPLGRAWYALYRETSNDAARVKDDPYGYFSCRLNVARFLDIDKKQFEGTVYGKQKTYNNTRILTLADGTVLTKSAANTDGKPAGEKTVIRKTVGGKSIVIKTGKKIRPTEANSGYHTVSFTFPQWAIVRTIADALAEIIPSSKFSASPGASEVYRSFTIKGGGSYGIPSQATALADNNATASVEAVKTKIKAKGGEVVA